MLPSDISKRDDREMRSPRGAAICGVSRKNLRHGLRRQLHQAVADASSNLSKTKNVWPESTRVLEHEPFIGRAEDALGYLWLVCVAWILVARGRSGAWSLLVRVPFRKLLKATCVRHTQ